MIRFDEQPVVHAPLEALDPALCEQFRSRRTRDEGLDFLGKLGIAALDDQGVAHPSVSGILMACREPRQWMPNAFIQAVAYHGNVLVVDKPAWWAYHTQLVACLFPFDHLGSARVCLL